MNFKINKFYGILPIILILYMFYFIIFFFDLNINTVKVLCENCQNEEIINKTIDEESNQSFDYNRLLLYISIALIVGGVISIFFGFFGGGNDDICQLDPTTEVGQNLVSISPLKKLVVDFSKKLTLYDYYKHWEPLDCKNKHLAKISDIIFTDQEVYAKDLPIFNMMSSKLNKVAYFSEGDLSVLYNMSMDQPIAFTHYFLLKTNPMYYQIVTVSDLIHLIEKFNITGY